jgi:hypothetical protein
MPAFLQTLPAFTAALAGARGRDKEKIERNITTFLFMNKAYLSI